MVTVDVDDVVTPDVAGHEGKESGGVDVAGVTDKDKTVPVIHTLGASYAIGQGYLQVNCLQLAVMTARLANREYKALNPRLVKSVGGKELARGSDVNDLPFPPEHIQYVRDGMAAVTEAGGTAFRASQLGLGDILMAGKTGTAQVRRISKHERETRVLKNEERPWKERDHALFVAFAPVEAPRIAVAVIVENAPRGGGSGIASPIARRIIDSYLLSQAQE